MTLEFEKLALAIRLSPQNRGLLSAAGKGALAGVLPGAVVGGIGGALSDDGSLLGGAANGAFTGATLGGLAGGGRHWYQGRSPQPQAGLLPAKTAGVRVALAHYGITEKDAGTLATIGRGVGAASKWLGRGASVVPGIGNAAGAVLGGVGGAIQGFANGEGLKGALTRGGIQAGANLLPIGLGIVAGIAGDAAANKMFTPKTPRLG